MWDLTSLVKYEKNKYLNYEGSNDDEVVVVVFVVVFVVVILFHKINNVRKKAKDRNPDK